MNKPPVNLDDLFVEDIDETIESLPIEAGMYDGSYPLDNTKHERLVQAVFAGVSRIDAYHENVSISAKRETAKKECARILKRDEVALRLTHLQESLGGMGQPLSRQEAIKTCVDICRSETASPDNKLKALDRLAKMHGWFNVQVDDPANKTPDPAYFYEFMKRAQVATEVSDVCPCCHRPMPDPVQEDTSPDV